MHDFEYAAPRTLFAALDLLQQPGANPRPLAGGTDLIDHVRTGRLSPGLVVDIKRLPELNVLEIDGTGLRLGAAVPCHRIYEHGAIVDQYSALADSCRIIGGIQIQSRASVGGNLCNSGPAADSSPSLMALAAICVIAGPNGLREVPVENFCIGPGKNVLQAGELLVEIKFPQRPPHSGSHYRRLIPRNEMDIAVVGVAVAIELDPSLQNFITARVALGAVAPTPLLVAAAGDTLAGRPVTDEVLANAAAAAREAASPITDMRGTSEYRRHAVGVLTERAIRFAVARARGAAPAYHPGR